jgi:hypothetical protein
MFRSISILFGIVAILCSSVAVGAGLDNNAVETQQGKVVDSFLRSTRVRTRSHQQQGNHKPNHQRTNKHKKRKRTSSDEKCDHCKDENYQHENSSPKKGETHDGEVTLPISRLPYSLTSIHGRWDLSDLELEGDLFTFHQNWYVIHLERTSYHKATESWKMFITRIFGLKVYGNTRAICLFISW